MRPSHTLALSLAIPLLAATGGKAAGAAPEPVLLLDPEGLADDVDPGELVASVGDVAFFYLVLEDFAPGGGIEGHTLRIELWRTDGTPPGTFPLIPPDTSLQYTADTLDGVFFFVLCDFERPIRLRDPGLCDSPGHTQLWRTDGTREGTFRVLEEGQGKITGFPPPVVRAVPDLGLFFFVAFADDAGYELRATDGTREGTRTVANVTSLGFRSPGRLTSFGGRLHFVATRESDGLPTWLGRSDGTPEGTRFQPAPFDGEIDVLALEPGDRRIFLLGWGPEERPDPIFSGNERRMTLWSLGRRDEPLRFDGDLGFRSSSGGAFLQAARGRVFVHLLHRPQASLQLWGAGAVPSEAELLAEVPFASGLSPSVTIDPLGLPEGKAFFSVPDDALGVEPWVTDGTAFGTEMLVDLCPGECGSRPVPLGLGPEESFLFAANDGVHGQELWGWRPATGAVELVLDLCPGECSGAPRRVGARDDRLYVVARRSVGASAVFEIEQGRTAARAVAEVGELDVSAVFEVLFGAFELRWTLLGDRWIFWAKDPDRRPGLWSLLIPESIPPVPPGPPLLSDQLPGFAVHVRIGGEDGIVGRVEADCIPETLCVAGALAGRSEVFIRIVGPKPNGKLWPHVVKFTTSPVEVWIEQLATGVVRYYRLEGASPGSSTLPGLFDRDGFSPAS